jgi:ABC-type transporter Mla MlaB component
MGPDPVMFIGATIRPVDVPALCRLARSLLARFEADTLVCDVGAVAAPDAATVDALARLQLRARRSGYEIRLRRVPERLEELLRLAGMEEALPLEGGRHAEQREQPGGVQEERDPGDPVA